MNIYATFNPQERKVAYFSMEVGLRPEIPTYSGGLGILAGDTLKSFADLGVPAVGVTLLYTRGYFHQEIDAEGNQVEVPVEWHPADFMALLADRVAVEIEGRTVLIQAWVYPVEGIGGHTVPVLFLDTDIDREEIWRAHQAAKGKLFDFIKGQYGISLDPEIFTIGFARRAATYKRATLLLRDIERLKGIAAQSGRLQLVFAGKAHPADAQGKALIKEIHQAGLELNDAIKLVYIPNYDMYRARFMVSGVDVWLNTPLRPMEASGTSGMKAAANGVINFSVLDGWWIEGHIDGVTGWAIGPRYLKDQETREASDSVDAEDLYDKLARRILPCFYKDRGHWMDMMAYNIALNGSFFNTHRMVAQYVLEAYFQ